jgi:L-methionine (R)-S-oxide reductase
VGPYQGGHGCLDIPFERGICGAAARTKTTQDVPDVHARPEHIACSSSTNSEVVVPVLAPSGEVVAVLDVDSDDLAAFSDADVAMLERVCCFLGQRYGAQAAAAVSVH